MKPKPEQEQTVGLTQVGTLHGELPGEFNQEEIAHDLFKECAKLGEQVREQQVALDFANLAADRRLKEIKEYEQVLAWASENVWSCTCCKSQHPQWIVNTDKFYYGITLYEALLAAWKVRGKK